MPDAEKQQRTLSGQPAPGEASSRWAGKAGWTALLRHELCKWLQASVVGSTRPPRNACQVARWVPASGEVIVGGRGSLPIRAKLFWTVYAMESAERSRQPSSRKSAPRKVCCAKDNPCLDSCCQGKRVVLISDARRVPGLLVEAEKRQCSFLAASVRGSLYGLAGRVAIVALLQSHLSILVLDSQLSEAQCSGSL